mmetsp:Transcript_5757/g.7118  ORF Transcript_5757/g.7118 Transcript_5757/m.7118 type:complete len:122 (-) Transcript_5757:175-540(-)
MSQIKSSNVYDLYLYCPSCAVRYQKSPQYLYHKSCNTRHTIDLNGNVGCSGYTKYCVKKKLINWGFTCDNHSNVSRKVDSNNLLAGLMKASAAISKVRHVYPDGIFDEILAAVFKQLENQF